jgi:hypothetical protein
MPRAEVIKLGKREGHTEITLKRAAKKLRVVSTPDTTKRGNPATWSLTDSGSSISDQLPMIPNQQPTDQEQHTQTGDFGSRSNVEPKPASTADTLADDHDDPAARISDHQPMIRNP